MLCEIRKGQIAKLDRQAGFCEDRLAASGKEPHLAESDSGARKVHLTKKNCALCAH